MKTRRQFLSRTSTAMAGLAVGSAVIRTAPAAYRAATPDALTYGTFVDLIRTSFHAGDGQSRPVRLRLVEVEPRPGSADECFTLTFRGPADRVLRQGAYLFQHRDLGAFDLFIVPGRPRAGSQSYYATINRYLPDPDA